MINPGTQDTEGLALAGRIEPNPLARNEWGEPRERSGPGTTFRVRRAPNPDGRSWRAEDEP